MFVQSEDCASFSFQVLARLSKVVKMHDIHVLLRSVRSMGAKTLGANCSPYSKQPNQPFSSSIARGTPISPLTDQNLGRSKGGSGAQIRAQVLSPALVGQHHVQLHGAGGRAHGLFHSLKEQWSLD